MLRALVVLVVAVLGIAALLWSRADVDPPHVSGFLETDEIRVGSLVGGRVKAVRVAEGALVRAGDVLVELEAFDLAERRAEAEAVAAARRADAARLVAGSRPQEIEQARARRDRLAARLDALVAGPRQREKEAARARVDEAAAAVDLARKVLGRAKALAARGAGTQDALDRAVEGLGAAEAALAARGAEAALLEEGTRAEDLAAARAELAEAEQGLRLAEEGSRAEDVAAAEAAAQSAEAAVRAIQRRADELVVRAPIDGVVDALDLQPGDLVAANSPVLSLLDRSTLWVRAYVPESVPGIAAGTKVEVSVDAWPRERFAGHVSFVARQAEFTPGNVQTPDERAKQVFRVKVVLDEGIDRLRPGMSADVWLPE